MLFEAAASPWSAEFSSIERMHPGEIDVVGPILDDPLPDQVIQQDPVVEGVERIVEVFF
jgi:hypothetical protein